MHQLLTPEIFTTCRPLSNDDRLRLWHRKQDFRRKIVHELIRRAVFSAIDSQQSAPERLTTPTPSPGVEIQARSSFPLSQRGNHA